MTAPAFEVPLAGYERILLRVASRFLDAIRPPTRHFAEAVLAGSRDVASFGLVGSDPTGPTVILGAWRPGLRGAPAEPLRCDGRKHPHALLLSPTGGGKTWTAFFPTLLCSWSHSTVVFDVKGELYRHTAAARSRYSRVLRFAPAEAGSARYNPLDNIRPGPHAVGDARNVVEHLGPDERAQNGARDPFWDQAAKAYLAGVILMALDVAPQEERCLAGVASMLAQGAALGDAMKASAHPVPATRAFIRDAAARLWNNSNERLVGSVTATVDSYLAPYLEPAMAEATRTSDFRPADLMCADRPVSLYLGTAKPDLERTRPLLRILVSQIMAELQAAEHADRSGNPKLWRLLWALDELPALGRLANLGTDLPVMRSMGMRCLMGAQGVRQIRDVYGRDTPILNNARWIVTRQNSLDEAREVSGLIGDAQEVKVAHSRSSSWSFGSSNSSEGETVSTAWRAAIQPAEIARLPEDRLLVFGEDKPILAYRTPPHWWQRAVVPA